MAVLRIRLLGDPVLRKKCRAVDRITKEDRQLIDDMIETMEEADGAGLAAPQVGVTRKIIVVHDQRDRPTAIINPKIVSRSNEIVCGAEGCLSLPRLQAEVKRPQEAVVRGRGSTASRSRLPAATSVAAQSSTNWTTSTVDCTST